ncbi:hypothetical protein Ddc_16781 [Ditylenchus destructor]|nr:hypothetical protein Ddc_16781 [Ditylenchus destructor]
MSTGSVQRTNSKSKSSSLTTHKGLGKMGAWPCSATILVSFVLSLVIAPQLGYAFPEISMDLNLEWEPEFDKFISKLSNPPTAFSTRRRTTTRKAKNSTLSVRRSPPTAFLQDSTPETDSDETSDSKSEPRSMVERAAAMLPFLPFVSAAELEVNLEFQQDSQEQTVSVERELDSNKTPTISAQHDYPPGAFLGANGQRFNQQPYGGGYGSPYGQGMGGYGGLGTDPGVTNFDFTCKCQAKSNLAKTLAPAPTDSNQAAQQQIQQLQEQIRRLQEQMNRQQAGKSSFEQFAQLLAQADGLDCSCSGSSSPFSNLSGGAQGRGGFPQQPYGQGGMGGVNGGFGSPYRGSGGYFPQQPYAGGAGQFGGYPPMIKA